MSEWKDLSPLQKSKINYGAMMLVAKEAKERGLLNFNKDEVFCSKKTSFEFEVGEGLTGVATLWPDKRHSMLVNVVIDFKDLNIRSQLFYTCGMPRPFSANRISALRELPESLIRLAIKPVPMRAVLA